VINGLTDRSHPCQIMADLQTFEERRGPIAGKTVAWVGDGNNVCSSFIHAAPKFGFRLNIAAPKAYAPDLVDLARAREAQGRIEVTEDPRATIVAVGGELDLHTAPSLQAALTALDSSGCILVDLTGVTFLDSTGLGVFVGALARAEDRQARLLLVANSPRIAKVFAITGLDAVLPLHPSRDEALASS